MIDPLLLRIIALSFAALFLLAGVHKLSDSARFLATFKAYEIVPTYLVMPVSRLIPLLEILAGVGWLAFVLFGLESRLISLLSIDLLLGYAFAIGINLARGRSYIDCGCSFSRAEGPDSTSGNQQLSVGLLLRNLVLTGLAFATLLPASNRALHIVDLITLPVAVFALTLIYGAYNQLLVNRSTIDSWRHKHA